MQARERCEHEKAVVYELLRTGMVGGPAQVFTRHHEKDITRIRCHVYGEKSKLTRGIIGHYANSLYIYCPGDVMPCDKDTLVVNKKPFDPKRIAKFSKDVLKKKFLDLRRLTLKYLTSFMTSLERCHHSLLFKRILTVIYLKK